MKITLLLLLGLPVCGFAQKERPVSKIDSFSTRTGAFLKKETIDLGKMPTSKIGSDLSLELVKVTDQKTSISMQGLKLQVLKSSVYVDQDEINGLSDAITGMRELVSKPAPADLTEYSFVSRTGLRTSLAVTAAKKWNFTLDLAGESSNGSIAFDPTKTEEVIRKFTEILATVKQHIANPEAGKRQEEKLGTPPPAGPPPKN